MTLIKSCLLNEHIDRFAFGKFSSLTVSTYSHKNQVVSPAFRIHSSLGITMYCKIAHRMAVCCQHYEAVRALILFSLFQYLCFTSVITSTCISISPSKKARRLVEYLSVSRWHHEKNDMLRGFRSK